VITLPEDMVRQEANCVHNEQLWWKGMERRPGSGKGAGEDTTSEPESSGGYDEEDDEDEEEGVVTPPPHFLSAEDLPSLRGLFS
jgi:hypothetical protein